MTSIKFKPNFFLTLLAILGLILFISLGMWQLNRAEEKRQILTTLEKRTKSQPINLNRLPSDQSKWQYQPVEFQGTYLNEQQFLLDNKIHKGKVGYEVITPVRIASSNKLVLVNRGWIPINQNRRLLPTFTPVFGLQTIHGMIRQPLGKGIVLRSENLQNANWPIRIQTLNFKLMAEMLKHPIYPFEVLLDKGSAHGFVRDWKFVNAQPEKHIGYAIQWFMFALILIVLYFVLAIKRGKKNDNNNGAKK